MNETLINILVEKVRAKEQLENEIAEIKAAIELELPEEGFKNDQVTISRRKGSTSESIDYKAFEKAEPKLYEELLADYKKVKITNPSVSYSFKKGA